MRIFIGLDIPEDIKESIHQYLHHLQKTPKGWESPHDYHQTLLFIGSVKEDEAQEIKTRLQSVHFEPFELELTGVEFFSRRVMYLSLAPSKELLALKDRIENLFPEWLRPDRKAFIPHVTVKRWQRYEYDELKSGLNQRPFKRYKFKVNKIELFESKKDDNNHKYHVILSVAA